MASNTAFALLRTDLGYASGSVPAGVRKLMRLKLDAAASRLAAAGIPVDESNPDDLDLLVMYAGWLYRCRNTQVEQPRALRHALRNRQAALQLGGAS